MKKIGILGGLGPPSTVKYYEWINEIIQARLGGQNTARIFINSLNGEDVKNFRIAGDAVGESAFYVEEARRLEKAGADCIVIASNTSHRNAPAIEAAIDLPLIHLAKATAKSVKKAGVQSVLLLGTAPTMEEDFYKAHLFDAGLNVIIPEAHERAKLSDHIYNELVKYKVTQAANALCNDMIKKYAPEIQGVILGCTELTLIDIKPCDGVQIFDTAKIHVEAIVDFALSQ